MYVGNYAERDAELTLNLWKVMQKELSDQDLGAIFDLETDLFPLSGGHEISWSESER